MFHFREKASGCCPSGRHVGGTRFFHFYYRESGETAASQLMEQMDGKEHPSAEICFGYELKDRESV